MSDDTPEKWGCGWTRRKFLTRVAQSGGAAALYETMVAMDLIGTPSAWAGMPQLAEDHGGGKSVLVLGAGIGGLTTAYILARAGYRVNILEANHRAGGRNFTARRGDMVLEDGEQGRTQQECRFDDGLYLNMGPGRLPYHHRRVLGYCQQLGVKLEPYIMNTNGNLFQSSEAFEGKPKVYREVQNDTRGYISELLAKAIDQNALDDVLDANDQQRLLGLLKVFGPLDDSDSYVGSTRDGCGDDPEGEETPNVYYNCQTPEKISLEELLKSEFWNNSFYDPVEFEWQPTLFQPVGGMDKIVEGFLRKVGHLITYNAPVSGIKIEDNCVLVKYMRGSEEVTQQADFCVSNIPCPILKDIPNNFSEYFAEAVEGTTFKPSCKVGWQCNTRFWENDNYEIYGGISWTDDIIEQIWYPSNDFFGQKGALTGAYIHNVNAVKFGKMPLAERIRVAKEGGARLHHEFTNNAVVPSQLGISIAWQNVPHQRGAWPDWNQMEQHDARDYRRILRPDKERFFITGDQASTLPGWQEGAMMSAEHVVELITGLKSVNDIPDDIRAPDTFRVRQGRG